MFETTHAPSSKFILASIIVVVVAAVIVAFYFNFLKFRQETETSTGPMPVYAAPGEVVGGFPKELILDEKLLVEESYNLNYRPDLQQYSVSFVSQDSMANLFNRYKALLASQGWTIINEGVLHEDARGLYARLVAKEVNIMIVNEAQNRRVDISYLIK